MAPTVADRAVLRVLSGIYATFADDVRRLRLDSGISIRALAKAAGIDPSHLARIELGVTRPSLETMVRITLALGSDLAARLYPNTGPLVRDRHQAAIGESLLSTLHTSWDRYAEIMIQRPSKGWIDFGFHHRDERVFVATEIQSDLRRLEQQLRWSEAKADSLPSWDRWPSLVPTPVASRLLVIRSTRATRAVAEEFKRTLRVAFPADPDDAIASLMRGDPWPGAGCLWAVRKRGSEVYRIVARL